MKLAEAMIRGYELAKTTELNGDLQLAIEVSKLKDPEVNLCQRCMYGNSTCTINPLPSSIVKNIGMSCLVTACNGYKEEK